MITNNITNLGNAPYFQECIAQKGVDLSRVTPSLLEPLDATILSANLERCHSSTQIMINGMHIAVFKGMQPGSAAPGIWITRSSDGSRWSAPEPLIQAPDRNSICWSPVLCQYPDGSVLLFYRVGPTPDKLTTHVLTTNDGVIFKNIDELLAKGIIGPTKTKSLMTPNGLLFGSSSEKGPWSFDGNNQGTTACHVECLEFNGRWTRSDNLQMPEGYNQDSGGAIEPTLFKYGINTNMIGMLTRNRNKGFSDNHKGGWALFSVSEDNGKTWSPLTESTLRNPDSSLDIIDLQNGKLIVFYNDSHDQRHRFSFALSSNGGITWSDPHTLIENEGEFPSAILQPDGKISVAYADKKGQLNRITIDPAKIEINGKPWM